MHWDCEWEGVGIFRVEIGWINGAKSLRLTVLLFQAGVAFLSSSWSEALLPP
jgi:hypothetical protein